MSRKKKGSRGGRGGRGLLLNIRGKGALIKEAPTLAEHISSMGAGTGSEHTSRDRGRGRDRGGKGIIAIINSAVDREGRVHHRRISESTCKGHT